LPIDKKGDKRTSCRADKKLLSSEKLAGRRKVCRPAKKPPAGEKAADWRKSCRPAKNSPAGERAADQQKTRWPGKKLPTGEKIAGNLGRQNKLLWHLLAMDLLAKGFHPLSLASQECSRTSRSIQSAFVLGFKPALHLGSDGSD
jgi:hypothetical protein